MNDDTNFKHPSFYPKAEPDNSHPISFYLIAWLVLFILSALSYYIDYVNLEGMVRWV